MAISTAPLTVQLEINQSLFNKHLQNVLHFRTEGFAVTIPDLESLVEAVGLWIVTFWAPLFSVNLTFTELHATSEDLLYPVEYSEGLYETGSKVGQAVPVNVSVATHFYTGNIGRSYKGRMYSSGITEGDVDGNAISPAHNAALQVAIEELPLALTTTPFTHVVVSRQQNLVVIDPAEVTGVNLYVVSPLVRDMGRRLNNS